MDSTAYLTKQGWRGSGHSLHPSGRGIKKPVLVSKKNNVLGVGKKTNDVHADQWWNRAFDSGLKSLKIGTAHAGSDPKREPTSLDSLVQARKQGLTKWGGLYGSFVKGDTMTGTINQSSAQDLPPVSSADPLSTHPNAGDAEERPKSKKKTKKHKRNRDIHDGSEAVHGDEPKSKAARKEAKKLKAAKRHKTSA